MPGMATYQLHEAATILLSVLSFVMGTIYGTLNSYPEACVIWVDAHADINTSETTGSGNIHVMPVSFLLGLGEKISEYSWAKPALKPERLVYIGLRDLDAGERRILKENNIKAFGMHEVESMVRGGLTFREGHYICEAIHESGLLVALDLMEVNPFLADPESVRQTVAVGCSLVRSALGFMPLLKGETLF
ncbi:Arginase/deacetylase [Paxillus ammoniavirescens]|nr:Arginase/deacetylase [Paxillus ammoniavirescens]